MNNVLQSNRYANTGLIARYESAGKRCGQIAVALGLAVLLGWVTGSVTLTSISPQWVAMPVSAALCLILIGISLFAAGTSPSDRRWRTVQLISATTVFGVGLATLLEYRLGIQLGVDRLFLDGADLRDHSPFPGRMAISTATNFLLAGAALVILDTSRPWLPQTLAWLIIGVSTLTLLGYAYGVSAFYERSFFPTASLYSAIGALLAGLGILLVRPAQGMVALLVSGTVGGMLARRLLPLAVAAPLLIGWLRIEGERRAIYDSTLGVALASVAYMIVFSLFTWRDAEVLRRTDELRLDAEHIKQENQAQMNGLIESAMDAIVMLDDAHSIIVFNPAAVKMFGYPSADILGCSLSKLLPQRFRTAHHAQMRAFAISESTSRSMGKLGMVTAVRADGTEFPAEASISHFNLGQSICYLAIVRDITERMRNERELHESEQRERERSRELSNLLFAVPAAVCIAHDRLLAEVRGNELHDLWFRGYITGLQQQPGTTEVAESIQDRHQQSGDVPSVQAALRQAAGGREIRDYEFKHEHPNGIVRYFIGNAVPLRDESGTAYGAISAFIDVTELKLAEQAMLSVTAGSVAKSDYITHMTHELRTPLGTMLGHAQMLEAGTPEPAPVQLKTIRQIIKAGWYLRDLITEVQDLATIEAQSANLAVEPVAVDPLLHELCEMIDPLVADAGLHVSLTGTNGLTIHANPVRIKQVMLNLLSNAIKYNHSGGSINVSRVLDGHEQVLFSVGDSGNGLTPKELACLFQPFNRLGQERGRVVGTGVGLVVTKKLVESMGGTMGAESEVGCGSLFWFKIPAAIDSARLAKCA